MCAKQKSFPYTDLGNLLKRWRASKYKSATALCSVANFSFSYGVYSAYERGEDLAPPAALEEIALFLNEDPREAMMVWAQVQMPSGELKAFFSPHTIRLERRAEAVKATLPSIFSNQIPPSEFDNTWVFGAYEREMLVTNPWLLDFLVGLAVSFPEEVSYERLGFEDHDAIKSFTTRFLQSWADDERVIVSDTGVRLTQPHIHMPKTESWQPVREGLLSRALDAVLPQLTPKNIRDKQCHRTLVHKILTEPQRDYWITKLGEFEMEFAMTATAGKDYHGPTTTFSLMMFLGERVLGLPEQVTKPAKK